jgi:hypothetical protein
MVEKHTYEGTKAFLKGRKPGLFIHLVIFHAPGSGSAFPVRIRVQEIQINRIHNTEIRRQQCLHIFLLLVREPFLGSSRREPFISATI